MTVLQALIVVATGAIASWYWLRRKRRRQLVRTALSAPQRAIVARQVPLTRHLPPDLCATLEGKINLFLDQVDFTGCNGLEVTEDMRLSIAAQACLLVVNSETWYDHLHSILVYPAAFKSRQTQRNGYVVTEKEIVRTGESWSRGPVILSWADTQRGALNETDGHNVVFHEFAHQIDDLSGHTDGVPNLPHGQSLSRWVHVFAAEYDQHVQRVHEGHKTVLDAYGATGPEEFFAVSVEAFFERPAALKHKDPAIYEQLAQFFQLDPIRWH